MESMRTRWYRCAALLCNHVGQWRCETAPAFGEGYEDGKDSARGSGTQRLVWDPDSLFHTTNFVYPIVIDWEPHRHLEIYKNAVRYLQFIFFCEDSHGLLRKQFLLLMAITITEHSVPSRGNHLFRVWYLRMKKTHEVTNLKPQLHSSKFLWVISTTEMFTM